MGKKEIGVGRMIRKSCKDIFIGLYGNQNVLFFRNKGAEYSYM
jgi:hypothetical protein